MLSLEKIQMLLQNKNQTEIANKTGLSRNTIWKFANGVLKSPSHQSWCAVSDYLLENKTADNIINALIEALYLTGGGLGPNEACCLDDHEITEKTRLEIHKVVSDLEHDSSLLKFVFKTKHRVD